jgi:hypothetical protein
MAQPKGRRTWRLGNRERSRLQLAIIIVICVLVGFVMYPQLTEFVERRDWQLCQANVLKIARAMKTYTQDWDDTLPLAASWTDAAQSHIMATSGTGKDAQAYFQCPLDTSGKPCSYEYNTLMEGLSLTVRSRDAAVTARRAQLGRIERAALLIEKHGSARNAAVPLTDWDTVTRAMDLPHRLSGRSGCIVQGDLTPTYRTQEQFELLAGKPF